MNPPSDVSSSGASTPSQPAVEKDPALGDLSDDAAWSTAEGSDHGGDAGGPAVPGVDLNELCPDAAFAGGGAVKPKPKSAFLNTRHAGHSSSDSDADSSDKQPPAAQQQPSGTRLGPGAETTRQAADEPPPPGPVAAAMGAMAPPPEDSDDDTDASDDSDDFEVQGPGAPAESRQGPHVDPMAGLSESGSAPQPGRSRMTATPTGPMPSLPRRSPTNRQRSNSPGARRSTTSPSQPQPSSAAVGAPEDLESKPPQQPEQRSTSSGALEEEPTKPVPQDDDSDIDIDMDDIGVDDLPDAEASGAPASSAVANKAFDMDDLDDLDDAAVRKATARAAEPSSSPEAPKGLASAPTAAPKATPPPAAAPASSSTAAGGPSLEEEPMPVSTAGTAAPPERAPAKKQPAASDSPATRPAGKTVPKSMMAARAAMQQQQQRFGGEPEPTAAPAEARAGAAAGASAPAAKPAPKPSTAAAVSSPTGAAPPPQPQAAAAADDDWDRANEQFVETQAAADAEPRLPPVLNITWDDALRELRAQREVWTPHVTPDLKRISAKVQTTGFLATCWSCWHHDITEGSPLYDERDFILALQKVGLDHSNALHRRILLTIWRLLSRPKRDEPDPPLTGSAWEALGFQGNNPATDLRSTGIFGLLQLLFLVDYCPKFAHAIFDVARSKMYEFPLAIVSFNFTATCMDCLLERLLHDQIVTRHRKQLSTDRAYVEKRMERNGGSEDVNMVLNELYIGLLYKFHMKWTEEPQRRVMEFDQVRRPIRQLAHDKTSTVLSCYTLAKSEFSREKERARREARVKKQLEPVLDKGPSKFSDF